MFTNRRKKGIGTSLCLCCCCMIIFGIIGIVYYEKSFLDVHHECEIFYVYSKICQYACGTICHRRLLLTESSDEEEHHCYTRYCWGYEYVYEWETMDWMYHPYRAQTTSDHDILYTDTQLSFINQSNQTEQNTQKLKALLDYINDESNTISLSKHDIESIDLEIYLQYTSDTDNIEHNIMQTIKDMKHTTTVPNTITTTASKQKHSTTSCDWKSPAYYTYGSCSAWPTQWNSLGDKVSCWSNTECTYFSTLSPYTNWDLARGFGFASAGCFVIFVLILLYWFMCWCYGKLCGWNEYDIIDDKSFSVEEYYDNRYDNEAVVVSRSPIIIDNEVPMNNVVPPVYVNEQMPINNGGTPFYVTPQIPINNMAPSAEEMRMENVVQFNEEIFVDEEIPAPSAPFADEIFVTEGEIDVVDEVQYDGAYTM